MQNKIFLITGATSGIGQATAMALAQKGATVILAGRSIERAQATVARIKAETGPENTAPKGPGITTEKRSG